MAKALTSSASMSEGTAYLSTIDAVLRQQLAQDIGRYLLAKDRDEDDATLAETLHTVALIVAVIGGEQVYVHITTKRGSDLDPRFAFGTRPSRW